MNGYAFDNIEDLQRNRDLERDGTELGLPGGRTLIVRAASDANPQWRAQSEKIAAELRRLGNARATNERVRGFLARKYAELLVRDWRGITSKGIKYSNIEPLHEASTGAPPAVVRRRPRANQDSCGNWPWAIATKLPRRASEASKS